jgi:hypothetical protein
MGGRSGGQSGRSWSCGGGSGNDERRRYATLAAPRPLRHGRLMLPVRNQLNDGNQVRESAICWNIVLADQEHKLRRAACDLPAAPH